MIEVVVIDESSGFYHVYADDIPPSHRSGQWWKDQDTIYLDQTHKYQNEIFKEIEAKLHT